MDDEQNIYYISVDLDTFDFSFNPIYNPNLINGSNILPNTSPNLPAANENNKRSKRRRHSAPPILRINEPAANMPPNTTPRQENTQANLISFNGPEDNENRTNGATSNKYLAIRKENASRREVNAARERQQMINVGDNDTFDEDVTGILNISPTPNRNRNSNDGTGNVNNNEIGTGNINRINIRKILLKKVITAPKKINFKNGFDLKICK